MAKTLHSILLILLFFVTNSSISAHKLKREKLYEKLSHLHFYFHDIVSGRNPTAVQVVRATNMSATGFGMIVMIDDPLTRGPDPKSKLVGRAQGLYGSASLSETALLMALNFVFVEGKYNGSTLSILERNAVLNEVREMPIIGGSGLFGLLVVILMRRLVRLTLRLEMLSWNTMSMSSIIDMP